MKYFTRDLVERYGASDDAVARAADDEWEATLERYEAALRSVEPRLPEHVREFIRLPLQGAVVWSIARRGDKLLMVLRKDVPPRDTVLLAYTLTEGPVIDREALAPERRGRVMDFLYDEFEVVGKGERPTYGQSILFGNGWEMTLRFRDVQVSLADPVYPPPDMTFVPAPASAAAPSA